MKTRTPRAKAKYSDFSGGVQVFTGPLWVKDNETPYCQNIDISRPGELKKALGYTQVGTATGGDSPRGIFTFDREDGSSTLFKLTNNTLSKYENGWVNVTGGTGFATGIHKIETALMYVNTGTGVGTGADEFEERVYISQGLDDTVRYTDGVNIGVVAGVYAKHIEVYKSRIFLGNIKQNNKTYPSRVIVSAISSDDFSEGDYIDEMGEPITALKAYSGSIFFFSENKLGAYDDYKLQILPGNFGTTNSSTVQEVLGRLIWYNRSGVFLYAGGGLPQKISKKVQTFIDAISDAREVTAHIDEEERYNLYIGDITYEGKSLQDVVLRYSVDLNAWDILPDRPFKYGARQRSGGVYITYASDTTQDRVWQVNNSQSLNGEEIESEWVSAKLDLGQPDTYKNFYEAHVTFKPQNVNEYFTLQYRLDGNKTWLNTEGTTNNISVTGTNDIETKRLMFPGGTVGKMIQFKLSHSSTGNGFNLYEIMLEYDELR